MPVTINGTNGVTFNNGTTQAISAGMGTSATPQTWQSMTASRAYATTYTNSTGYPIQVIVSGNCLSAGQSGLTGIIQGSTIMVQRAFQGGTFVAITFTVPTGNTYQVNSDQVAFLYWWELR
jgi:hypothetical protein